MPDPRSSSVSDSQKTSEDKRLERLYDYTKFHIGIYLSTAAGIATLLGSEKTGWFIAALITENNKIPLYFALGLMILAGMCGAVVASSTIEHQKFEDFWHKPQGPQSVPFLRANGATWAAWEHFFFWISLLVLSVSVAWGFAKVSSKPSPAEPAQCCCQIAASPPQCTPK